MAIEDQSPCRRQGLQLDPIAFGACRVFTVMHDHQLAEARQQDAEDDKDDGVSEHRAALEQLRFELLILDRCAPRAADHPAASAVMDRARAAPDVGADAAHQATGTAMARPPCRPAATARTVTAARSNHSSRIHRSSTRSLSSSPNTAPACCQTGKKRKRWRNRSVRYTRITIRSACSPSRPP